MSWFAEYTCGCVSDLGGDKKDILDYCGTHGNDVRHWHGLPSDKTLRRKLKPDAKRLQPASRRAGRREGKP